MNSVKNFLLKNHEPVLYLICLLAHAAVAPAFNYYRFTGLFLYNTVMTFTYGVFILLFSNTHKKIFISFAYAEIIFYSLLLTVTTGSSFGTLPFAICIIPALFFFVYTPGGSRKFNAAEALLAAVVTLFIIWWEFARPKAIFTEYLPTILRYKTFFRINSLICSFITLFTMTYLSIITSHTLSTSFTKRKKESANLYNLANHDQLTGLLNRRKIYSILNECQGLKELQGNDYAISIFDIDNFKSVNDTWGHDAGDLVLTSVTQIVSAQLSSDVQFARWGGEEFLLVYKNYNPQIKEQLEQIRKKVQDSKIIWNNTVIPVTITFGLSSSRSGLSNDRIIINADDCLYNGKQNGKNQIVVSPDF